MAATIKDIARETGLGVATISSYLNGGHVREKNRIKIEEAIDRLHFEVNELARGLKTNTTRTIGVVIPELNNVFCAEVLTAMEDVLRSQGYATIICDCRTDRKLEREAVEFLGHRRVDGIINMPVDESGAHLESFRKAGKPIVLIDRRIRALNCDSVFVDNRNAAKNAVSMLLENGHQKIGIISGPDGIYTARERLKGYKEALRACEKDVEERLIYHGDYQIESGVTGLESLVKRNPDMTAVFVTNYEMTMGALIGANQLEVKIPEQISLIGFDNLSFAEACRPKLTIVAQPTKEIGIQASRQMLKRLRQKEEPKQRAEKPFCRKLQTRIVKGDSVRAI